MAVTDHPGSAPPQRRHEPALSPGETPGLSRPLSCSHPLSQSATIAAYLKTGKTLTPLQALEQFQCFRLAARIEELRRQGLPIECRMVGLGRKRWAQYKLSTPGDSVADPARGAERSRAAGACARQEEVYVTGRLQATESHSDV